MDAAALLTRFLDRLPPRLAEWATQDRVYPRIVAAFERAAPRKVRVPEEFGQALALAQKVQGKWGDDAYHEAVGDLYRELARLVKNRAEDAEDPKGYPERVVYALQEDFDELARAGVPGAAVVANQVGAQVSQLTRDVKERADYLASKARSSRVKAIEKKYPGYTALLAERRKLKAAIRQAEQAVHGTQAFRVMGGLAKIGAGGHHVGELRRVEAAIQRMEKS